MAQRLATKYVKTCLHLTEADFSKFIQLFTEHQVFYKVKVLENGNQEVVLEDNSGEEIILTFEKISDHYVTVITCLLYNVQLANIIRKAISMFKGSALVNRIYAGFHMEYEYQQGRITKITEVRDGQAHLVYEKKDTLVQKLEQLYANQRVENEIKLTQERINELLDLRNNMEQSLEKSDVDRCLQRLTHKLFILEA